MGTGIDWSAVVGQFIRVKRGTTMATVEKRIREYSASSPHLWVKIVQITIRYSCLDILYWQVNNGVIG